MALSRASISLCERTSDTPMSSTGPPEVECPSPSGGGAAPHPSGRYPADRPRRRFDRRAPARRSRHEWMTTSATGRRSDDDPAEIAEVRVGRCATSPSATASRDRAGDLVLALDEVIANAQEHGHAADRRRRLGRRPRGGGGVATVGSGFDRGRVWATHPPAPLRHARGRGLWITRQLTDHRPDRLRRGRHQGAHRALPRPPHRGVSVTSPGSGRPAPREAGLPVASATAAPFGQAAICRVQTAPREAGHASLPYWTANSV